MQVPAKNELPLQPLGPEGQGSGAGKESPAVMAAMSPMAAVITIVVSAPASVMTVVPVVLQPLEPESRGAEYAAAANHQR